MIDYALEYKSIITVLTTDNTYMEENHLTPAEWKTMKALHMLLGVHGFFGLKSIYQ